MRSWQNACGQKIAFHSCWMNSLIFPQAQQESHFLFSQEY